MLASWEPDKLSEAQAAGFTCDPLRGAPGLAAMKSAALRGAKNHLVPAERGEQSSWGLQGTEGVARNQYHGRSGGT